jgi:hypothetical protein
MFRRCVASVCLMIAPVVATADCARPVCLVDVQSLRFTKLIDFDDVINSMGIGSRIDHVLVRDGAVFGERFAGQSRGELGDYDLISGTPLAPLMVLDGGPGQTLGAMRLMDTIVLHGHGPRQYPSAEAVGEGSVAVLFDRDQPAMSFDIRGGEQGYATVQFLRRDGSLIDSVSIGPLSETSYAFRRNGQIPDIAGFLLLNTDPQGVALDNLRFESNDVIG